MGVHMIKKLTSWLAYKKLMKLRETMAGFKPNQYSNGDWPYILKTTLNELPIEYLHVNYTMRKMMDTRLVVYNLNANQLISQWQHAMYLYASGQDVPNNFMQSRFSTDEPRKVYLDEYLVHERETTTLMDFLKELRKCLNDFIDITETVDGTYYHRSFFRLYKETHNVIKDIVNHI